MSRYIRDSGRLYSRPEYAWGRTCAHLGGTGTRVGYTRVATWDRTVYTYGPEYSVSGKILDLLAYVWELSRPMAWGGDEESVEKHHFATGNGLLGLASLGKQGGPHRSGAGSAMLSSELRTWFGVPAVPSDGFRGRI
jgi:hypothetical protein